MRVCGMPTCKLFTAPAVKEIFGGADPPTQTNQPECLLFMGEPVCSYLHDKSPPRVKESAHDFTPLSHSLYSAKRRCTRGL